MSKFINKSKLNGNFSILPNDIVNSENLSLKSKGLLWYLLSKPEDWQVNVADIENKSIDGKASVKAGIIELENNGYIVKEKHRKKNGNFDGWDYFVYDSPKAEKPTSVNRTQLSTEVILSTNIISKDISSRSVSPKGSTDTTRENYNTHGKIKLTYENLGALKKILTQVYPKNLTGFSDPKILRSTWSFLQPRKGQDGWMSGNPMENLKNFFMYYLESTEEKYYVESMYKLNQLLRDWRERGGK